MSMNDIQTYRIIIEIEAPSKDAAMALADEIYNDHMDDETVTVIGTMLQVQGWVNA